VTGGAPALIVLEEIRRTYHVGGEVVRALDGVSIAVNRGEWVAIVGQSGSGKSTLMNILGCLDTPTSGRYLLNGTDVRGLSDDELADLRNKEIGFVFQTFQLLARSTALANVELPLVYRGVPRRQRREMAKEALVRVGLEQRMHHRPTSSPAASASASPSPAPWSAGPRYCSPTSRPATSTPPPARRSSGSSPSCTRRATPSSSLPTSRSSPRAARARCGSPTAGSSPTGPAPRSRRCSSRGR
jgi:hypothetical protein